MGDNLFKFSGKTIDATGFFYTKISNKLNFLSVGIKNILFVCLLSRNFSKGVVL